MIVAALLAIMLGVGLGYASYSFITEPPKKTTVKALDLYTQRGGLGADAFGGIFEQNETVQLFAYLTADGSPINQTEVTLTVRNPNEQETVNTVVTDDSGNAKVDFMLLIEESALGNWSVSAAATVENETISDSMIFECQPIQIIPPVQRAMDLYTQQGGLGADQFGGIFGPNEVVQLFAYLTANGLAVNETEVMFTIIDPSGNPKTESALTDDQGIAKNNLTLPAEELAIGNWSITAVAYVEDETLSDSLVFECQIASTPILVKTLDVYTQRGGLGIDEFGGVFEQEEGVQLFAYLTAGGSPINLTEVSFTVTDPNGNGTVESALTDALGKARINFTLPSEDWAVGNWTVTASAYVENETVSDSMVFACKVKGTIPPVWKTLDLYTQRGGLGPDELGGVFGPGEVVELFAYLTGAGMPINETEVAFAICQYGGIPVTESALTDGLGIANVNFTIPGDRSSEGNWTVSAVAYVENEAVNDSLFFGCMGTTASMFVVTKKNGELCANFNPMDYVTVAVHVYCEYELLPLDLEVDVLLPNGSYFLKQSLTTDMWADAVTEFQIPQIDNVFGTWAVQVSCEAYGRQIWAYTYFDCQPSETVLDVFTQRGGQGQNVPSGSFFLGENVSLTALLMVQNSTAAVGKLVSFEVKFNGSTVAVLTAETNSSGMASVFFSIPSDASFAGPWEVYARVQDGGMVLLDTLVFAAEQPQG